MRKKSLTLILFSIVMLAAVLGTAAFFDVPPEENLGAKTEIVSESNTEVYAENFLEDLANRLDEGLVTQEEAMREYGAYSSRDVQFVTSTVSPSLPSAEASASAVKNETYVEGKLQWQYRLNPFDASIVTAKDIAADTVTAPLRGVRVVLLDKDFLFSTDPIAETYTDENGEYEFAFSNGHGIFERKDDIFIRIYAAGETFNIYGLKNYDIFHRLENVFNLKVFDFGLNHYIEKEVYKNVETGSMTRIDAVVEYKDDNFTNQAFSVAQALEAAQRFAIDAGGIGIDGNVKVFYPFEAEEVLAKLVIMHSPLAWLIDELSGEVISGKLAEALGKTELKNVEAFCYNRFMFLREEYWQDFNTVMHEYGHFLEWRLDIYGQHTKVMFWEHFSGHSRTEDAVFKKGKPFGMDLAWSEGWAYAFAACAINYSTHLHSVFNVNEYLHPKDRFGVPQDDIGGYATFDPSTAVKGENSGEGNERAIAAFLIDLFCPYEGKPSDRLSLGYAEFFRVSGSAGVYTFHELALKLEEEYPQHRDVIGARMGFYRMAPEGLTLVNSPSIYNPPSFEWTGNGSLENRNNFFDLVFYDANGEEKWSVYLSLQQVNLSAVNHRGTLTYTLSLEEWHEALSHFSFEKPDMRIAVRGYVSTQVKVDLVWPLPDVNYHVKTGPYTSAYCFLEEPLFTEIGSSQVGNSITIDNNNPSFFYKFTAEADGEYKFYTMGSTDTLGFLCEEDGVFSAPVLTDTNSGPGDNNFSLTKTLAAGEVVYVCVSRAEGTAGGSTVFYAKPSVSFEYFETTNSYFLLDVANASGEVTIPSEHNGKPVTGISAYAFNGYTNLTGVVVPAGVLQIGSGAFAGCVNLTDISLPEGLYVLGASSFINCENLKEITLPESLQAIGSNAFLGCKKLETVNVLCAHTPYLAKDVFIGCDKLEAIIVADIIMPEYKKAANWKNWSRFFKTKEIQVFIEGYDELAFNANYYSTLQGLTCPQKDGYDLEGLYFNGQKYTIDSVLAVWADSITLVPEWTIAKYGVVYENAALASNIYTKEAAFVLPVPEKTGYVFDGWFETPLFEGEAVTTVEKGSSGDKTFYAKWTAETAIVLLRWAEDEHFSGAATVTLNYDQASFVFDIPSKEGNIFMGWYDQDSLRYANSFGELVRIWDKTGNVELHARWRAESYIIEFDFNGSISWVNSQGFSDETNSVLYDGQVMTSEQLVAAFKATPESYREGHIFDSITDALGNKISWGGNVPNLTGDGEAYKIKPVWQAESHSLVFEDSATGYSYVLTLDFDAAIVLPKLSRAGYTFVGWKVAEGNGIYSKGAKFTAVAMPDLTPGKEGNDVLCLVAVWDANEYVVSFNADGGNSVPGKTVVFGSSANTVGVSAKAGFVFDGWCFDGVKYFSADGTAARDWDIARNAVLTASWVARVYLVCFDSQGGEGGSSSTQATFLKQLPQAPNVSAPTRKGYGFGGYFTAAGGLGTKYYTYSMTGVANWNIDETSSLYDKNSDSFTLYAYWTKLTYTVEFVSTGGSAVPNMQYNIESGIANFDSQKTTRYMYQFDTWCEDAGLTKPIKEIKSGNAGNRVLYARWKGKVTTPTQSQTSIRISDEVAILNLSALSDSNNYKITIGSAVTEITIIGKAGIDLNMCIEIASRSSKALTLRLIDLRFIAPMDCDGITSTSSFNLNLKLDGKINITGGVGASKYTVNATGNQGQSAIDLSGCTIKVFNEMGNGGAATGTLTLKGGNGGKSGPGENGSDGAHGQKGANTKDTKGNAENGAPGAPGTDGKIGATGADGGHAVIAKAFDDNGCSVTATGGNGGSGGNGGAGGCGGNGGNGGSDNYWLVKGYPGNGGNGGKGGNGGQGGNGGDAGYGYCIGNTLSGDQGLGGGGGEGGEAGIGGAGGGEGSAGAYGNDGKEGVAGENGEVGGPGGPGSGSSSCVAEGTLITLADGKQVAVEELTGDEMLLVWNHVTGTFDAAPIIFIHKTVSEHEIIHLYFSDGTEVKIIYEHAFWDIDLNKYVYIRNDAKKYLNHWFNKQVTDAEGNLAWTKVQLVDVEIYNEYTTAWSPVTFAHLNFYVNSMLSMPGDTEGLTNIFEVNKDTLEYDREALMSDIEKYGLFTYEEFADAITKSTFDAFQVQYLKIAIGKGQITLKEVYALIERYSEFF